MQIVVLYVTSAQTNATLAAAHQSAPLATMAPSNTSTTTSACKIVPMAPIHPTMSAILAVATAKPVLAQALIV